METICPFCHQKHAISEATVRKQMRCPGCHHTFTANPVTGLGSGVKAPTIAVPPIITRNTGGAPPLPTACDPGVTAKTAEELLAGYQGMRNRNASPLTRIVEAVKKPIRVVRLRRQVSSLQQALDAAWENVGTLSLGHRPFQSHLRAELPELSALQQQVGEKQSMADSLRQTKGSNAVLREVEAELAGLRDRQRRLMIAIGQKAEAGTPDIPDGPAHYAAVKRLRSALESAERELLGLEQRRLPTERLGRGSSVFFSSSKTPLIAAGAVLGIILVLCAGWWLLSPGVPSHIKKVVFDESEFAQPLLLQLPGDDGEVISRLKDRRQGEQSGLPMFFTSAGSQFQAMSGGEALLDILTKNGFAQMETTKVDTFAGSRSTALLTYRDTLRPYCVDRASQFTSPFQIAIATRQLESIDFKNAYKGEIPPVRVKTDFYAVTFSYLLKADFPGLPRCDRVFKGEAKAFYDLDTGVWKAEVRLHDDGGDEYLKLLAAQRNHGP